jgi:hypothetical protein
VRVFPSLNDIAFLLPIFVLFARMNGTQLLFSDGDTGWHIRTGEWILANSAVPAHDLFSFTKADQPWFAWEWAWDVLAATVHHYAGLAGIGFVTAILLGLFTLLVYQLTLRVSKNHLAAIVVTAIVAAVSSIHWLARPHLVSWIFTLIYLSALESARTEVGGAKQLLTVGLPILAMIWANMHGGFVAGLLIIACYGIGETLSAFLSTDSSDVVQSLTFGLRKSAIFWQSLALCSLATFVNPYGWQLHKHIWAYLNDADLLNNIQEFQSISFHAGPALYLEIMLLLAGLAACRYLQSGRLTPVILICLWAHFALVSARHIPLFAIVAAPFAAELLANGMIDARKIRTVATVAGTLSDISKDLAAIESTPRFHLISAGAVAALATLFSLGQTPFAPKFNPEAFPEQAAFLFRDHPGSRVFTTDQWGDYLLYRFYPSQKVFFDGRSDFYGNDFVKVNQRLAGAEHDWKSLLRKYSINLVMLRPETPLSAVLKLTADSKVVFDDCKVIVFDTSRMLGPASTRSSRQGDAAVSVPNLSRPLRLSTADVALTTNARTHYKKEKNHED